MPIKKEIKHLQISVKKLQNIFILKLATLTRKHVKIPYHQTSKSFLVLSPMFSSNKFLKSDQASGKTKVTGENFAKSIMNNLCSVALKIDTTESRWNSSPSIAARHARCYISNTWRVKLICDLHNVQSWNDINNVEQSANKNSPPLNLKTKVFRYILLKINFSGRVPTKHPQ